MTFQRELFFSAYLLGRLHYSVFKKELKPEQIQYYNELLTNEIQFEIFFQNFINLLEQNQWNTEQYLLGAKEWRFSI